MGLASREQPVGSIVTVCCNAAATLGTCIACVVAQRCPALDSFMIDGGATGDSLERPRAASATLVPEPDRGICDAMNKAIARAAGEFSMFPNADDCFGDAHAVADAVADMAKLAAIGWRARIGFRAGLAGSYRWYLDQPTPRH